MSNLEGSKKPMISVKASFEGELRRFSIERPFAFGELLEKVLMVYGLKEGVELKYLDDEGDYVSMSCDVEVEEALRISEKIWKERSRNVLRVEVTRKEKQQENKKLAAVGKLARFHKLKKIMREHRQKLQQERRQKIEAERKTFKMRLAEKRNNFQEKLKMLREKKKCQHQEIKKHMKQHFQTLKQQWKSEKQGYQKQMKELKKQMRGLKVKCVQSKTFCCHQRKQACLSNEKLIKKFSQANILPIRKTDILLLDCLLKAMKQAQKKAPQKKALQKKAPQNLPQEIPAPL